jgi:hypothetical protein
LTPGESDPATYWEECGRAPEFFSTLSRREIFYGVWELKYDPSVVQLVARSLCCVTGGDDVTVCLQRTYDIKWRVWNEQSDILECCFLSKIKLVK